MLNVGNFPLAFGWENNEFKKIKEIKLSEQYKIGCLKYAKTLLLFFDDEFSAFLTS